MSLPGGPTHLLYLHGFRSSPKSFKAERVRAWLAAHRPDVHWWCPQLPPSPHEALTLVEAGLAGWPIERMAVIGSSLGGFYATVVAERFGCPAVVLNPAIDPARDLARHIGEQTSYHDPRRQFVFRADYVDELRTMAPGELAHAGRCLAIIAKGDELLDWSEMSARYTKASMRLIDGSDHALSDFDDHLPALITFLHL